jgi:hypothetical protein
MDTKRVTILCICPVCERGRTSISDARVEDIDTDLDIQKDIVYLLFKICATESGKLRCPMYPRDRVYTSGMYEDDVERITSSNALYTMLEDNSIPGVSSKSLTWRHIPLRRDSHMRR